MIDTAVDSTVPILIDGFESKKAKKIIHTAAVATTKTMDSSTAAHVVYGILFCLHCALQIRAVGSAECPRIHINNQ